MSSFILLHIESPWCNLYFEVMYLALPLRDFEKKMIVVMRTGENAPTEEQVERTHQEVRRLIKGPSRETYLEEQADMEPQVREQKANNPCQLLL